MIQNGHLVTFKYDQFNRIDIDEMQDWLEREMKFDYEIFFISKGYHFTTKCLKHEEENATPCEEMFLINFSDAQDAIRYKLSWVGR